MDFLKEKFRYIFVLHKHNKVWKSLATMMAAIVVFVTLLASGEKDPNWPFSPDANNASRDCTGQCRC